ncbi:MULTISPECIES: thioredoxin family protein [Sphingobacteriaceae]|uniref:Thioredoxin family protein n=1 Tax=Sphingobacterium sp. (strain 21) TaxID=743722 RepID=F4C1D1_SPHS2
MSLNHIPQERFSYDAYIELVKQLVEKRQTTGPDQSSFLANFTALNLVRMQRIGKMITLKESLLTKLSQLKRQYVFTVITEAWCGDAAQILPVIAKIAEANPSQIDLFIVLRDSNTDYMDQYLTNGARGIPKLIIYDVAENKEILNWGPRPKELQLYIESLKVMGLSKEEWIEKVMLWYTKDKTKTTQDELEEAIGTLQ